MINRFIRDIRKYYNYAIKAGKAELKSEIASSHLSWLWWILDPLLFMLVYSFVALIVFGRGEKYFSAFVFIGYTSYQFFERTVKSSVKLVARNKSIVKNVYIPKTVLMLTKLYVNGFKSAIAFSLVFITMAIYRVPLTYRVIYFIPLAFLLILLSEGVGLIMMHYGVFVEDLSNIVNVTLRLLFYMSGVFYSIGNRIDDKQLEFLLLRCNPLAFIMDQMRKCLLYSGDFDFGMYAVWVAVSVILIYIGVRLVYKNENGYVKVI